MGEEKKITRIINFLSGSGVNGCTNKNKPGKIWQKQISPQISPHHNRKMCKTKKVLICLVCRHTSGLCLCEQNAYETGCFINGIFTCLKGVMKQVLPME